MDPYLIADVLRQAERAAVEANALELETLESGAMRGEFEICHRLGAEPGRGFYFVAVLR